MIPDFYVLVFLFCHFSKVANLIIKFANDFYLIVLKKNLIAQAFYEMFGFEETLDQIADQTEYGIVHEVVFTSNDKKSTLD